MKICIDAGHGGTDSGAVGVNGRYEKHDALRMALALRDEMVQRGHTVIMTRTGDTYPSLRDRYNLANGAGADVYVSLHRNSADSHTATGLEVLYRTITDKSAANDAKSRVLAEDLDKYLVAATGFRDREAIVQNRNTAVLQHTKMPAVTVEAGFVVNANDNARFDSTFAALIDAMADCLEAHFGVGIKRPVIDVSAGQPVDVEAAPGVVPVPEYFAGGGIIKLTSPYTSGTNVAWIQNRLARHNALVGQVDGIFGPKTQQGVKLFQAARAAEGRDIGAVDGIVGIRTARILAE